MAEKAGIALRTYQYMEDGNIPQRPNLEAIAKAHRKNESELFRDPDMKPDPQQALKVISDALEKSSRLEFFMSATTEELEIAKDAILGLREASKTLEEDEPESPEEGQDLDG